MSSFILTAQETVTPYFKIKVLGMCVLLFGNLSLTTRPFLWADMCSSIFQSKEIGLQMHEELLKVTNELYTVSSTQDHCYLFGSLVFSLREAGQNLA